MNRRKFIQSLGLGFLTLPLMGFRQEPELQTVEIKVKSDGVIATDIFPRYPFLTASDFDEKVSFTLEQQQKLEFLIEEAYK